MNDLTNDARLVSRYGFFSGGDTQSGYFMALGTASNVSNIAITTRDRTRIPMFCAMLDPLA
jgi:hypothetical protein